MAALRFVHCNINECSPIWQSRGESSYVPEISTQFADLVAGLVGKFPASSMRAQE